LSGSSGFKSGTALDTALASFDVFTPVMLGIRVRLADYIASIDPALAPPAGDITINNEIFNDFLKNSQGENIADVLSSVVFPALQSSYEVY